MKERAGKKKVVLELGGNAGAIVDATADLDWAVKRCLVGAFTYAGQVCISVQRLFVHEDVWESSWGGSWPVRAGAQGGRPARPRDTDSAPWSTGRRRSADPALGRRGRGGGRGRSCSAAPRTGTFFPPTILTDVPHGCPGVLQRGVRAARGGVPVPRLRRRDPAEVNDSCFGLQTGVFTNDLATRGEAFEELEVGGVIVNDVPTYRIDHMPYGGVKDSGLGREGLRWAIEDMTEIRIMVLAQPG